MGTGIRYSSTKARAASFIVPYSGDPEREEQKTRRKRIGDATSVTGQDTLPETVESSSGRDHLCGQVPMGTYTEACMVWVSVGPEGVQSRRIRNMARELLDKGRVTAREMATFT